VGDPFERLPRQTERCRTVIYRSHRHLF
jgi:hypothetical protein